MGEEKENTMLKKFIGNHHTISIIGTAKNVGKTTVLNQIIKEYKGIKMGITSIGLDGEKVDNISYKPKPRIMVHKNMFIATAKKCLEQCYFEYDILEETDIRTGLGNIVIIEVKSSGLGLVAGPSTNHEMLTITALLNKYGVEKIFIDGALFRKSIASFNISDAVIFSTGASYSIDLNEVVEDTVLLVKNFNLRSIEDEAVRIAKSHLNFKVVIMDSDFFVTPLKIDSVAGNEEYIISQVIGKTRAIYINGAFTSNFVKHLINKRHEIERLTVVINDASQLLMEPNEILSLRKMNIDLRVVNRIEVIALTYNPYSPSGYSFDDEEFRCKLQDRVTLPVINVLQEKK